MKYIKYYENIKNNPEKGDYVIVNMKDNPTAIGNLLEKYIGRITTTLLPTATSDWSYSVKFGNIEWWIKRREIVDWSKNKEDLEHYIIANKFNI